MENFLPLKIFDLGYGESGSAKSEYVKALIRQALKENPGKIVKLIVGDGSGATYAPIIRAGKGYLIDYVARPWPLDTLNKLTAGWTLKDKADPMSPLVKPSVEDLTNVCMTVFEGVNTCGKYIMGSVQGGMAYRAANGEQLGPDAAVSIREGVYNNKGELLEGPGTAFGTNGTAHYMAAQAHIMEFIQRSRSLPGHVIWTAHELIMDDSVNIGDLKNPVKIKKGTVIGGPDAGCGKILTPNLQRVFNNTWHCQTLQKATKGSKDEFTGSQLNDNDIEFRLWTREHYGQTGATGVKYKALTRNVPENFPAFFTSETKGQAIVDFYKRLHEIELKEAEEF